MSRGLKRIRDRGVALISRLQDFETEMPAEEANFAGLAGLSRVLIAKAEALDSGWPARQSSPRRKLSRW